MFQIFLANSNLYTTIAYKNLKIRVQKTPTQLKIEQMKILNKIYLIFVLEILYSIYPI